MDEIRSILAVLSDFDRDAWLMTLTAILTGLRQGEQFALRWEDIDWKHNLIRVRRELYWAWGKHVEADNGKPKFMFLELKTKNSKRDIDLSPELKKALREHSLVSEKKGLVFRSANGSF